MVKPDPQYAADYDPRTAGAVRQTLVEIGQILGAYQGKFAVVGGAVPWLLLHPEDMAHVGTFDIDLALDPEALADTEYADLIAALQAHGYVRGPEDRAFQLTRQVPSSDDGPPIDVVVDFLMPRNAVVPKRERPLVKDFAVQKADGADLAIDFQQLIEIEDRMPGGKGMNRIRIAVASLPALLAMKGHALTGRLKRKDAYDIYYCVRNYPEGPEALAEACKPLLGEPAHNRAIRKSPRSSARSMTTARTASGSSLRRATPWATAPRTNGRRTPMGRLARFSTRSAFSRPPEPAP